MTSATRRAPPAVWYNEGLAFSCQGCGRCCRGPGGYVWLTVAEAESMARVLELPPAEFASRYLRRTPRGLALRDGPGGDCIMLDSEGRCRVYPARPRQCRTYPWWPEVVASREDWERDARNCPGMNRGRVYSPEEIAAVLHEEEA